MHEELPLTRRSALGVLGATMLSAPSGWSAAPAAAGVIVGEPTAERVGNEVFASGGSAIDALVAGALAAAVAAPNQTGIGGYGASGLFSLDHGKRIVALDANSTAPAAMTKETFHPDRVKPRDHQIGWLSAGVPGILAGLQLVIDNLGTRPFRDGVQPAIKIATEGYPWPISLANTINNHQGQLGGDPGSRALYFRDGKPLAAGETFRNPRLASMLETLARDNSVADFYQGEIARQIADAFQKNGRLVTVQDLAAHQARLVEPIMMTIGDRTVYAAPLTAAGVTVMQALSTLQAMDWISRPKGTERTMARLEALRLAWRDRLSLMGDPQFVPDPTAMLLSAENAHKQAKLIEQAVKAGKAMNHDIRATPQAGTINLTAADQRGNVAILTLTHGNAFGAQVTVENLGLTLGHGMSRFDPRPDHPNAPGPGKRPLHNMTPMLVTEHGRPTVAVGGRGGRKIPNAVFEVMTGILFENATPATAIARPRWHTEGSTKLTLEKADMNAEVEALKEKGYAITAGGSATLSAVAIGADGKLQGLMR